MVSLLYYIPKSTGMDKKPSKTCLYIYHVIVCTFLIIFNANDFRQYKKYR